MAVCIAGMHRSGTSMVSRLLYDCGLYLGPDEDLMPPKDANQAGFWENAYFVALNEELLSQMEGGWDLPPESFDPPKKSPRYKNLVDKTHFLIEQFVDREPWGWKDPRNSLTLRFWEQFLPNLKLVVCIRNPVEVTRSLNKWGKSSDAFGYNLWLAYNQRLLFTTNPERRIFTHFDSYFIDPLSELRRLTVFLGMDVSDETIHEACQTIDFSLRHNQSPGFEEMKTQVPSEVLNLYRAICFEAGPVFNNA